eukprot:CAMPEP_0181377402 /NCGR_PEP_ID=MMETSP1106-20121128/17878_1 /TAXON_ID=81844 /ORGANISM="Mantoniella antarctica, Strain SL-175" /LENGTH=128 /DNA_ID=CAMNT_0023496135 /DNA_START=19 /DNA_END=405 /DNA_ORIENTATION=+
MAKAPAAAAPTPPPTTRAPRMDSQGNVMNASYWVQQLVGMTLALFAFGSVCFAGYANQYPALIARGFTVNFWLYGGCLAGFVGLFFHENRPFKNDNTFTFDKKAVEARKQENAEKEASFKSAKSKKKE